MNPPPEHTETAALHRTGDRNAEKGGPVFILGIMPRSGTNFLHRLLCRHPECGAINTTPVREDYLTHHIGWLGRYLGRLRWQWGHWGADSNFVAPLAVHVGKGLTGFLGTLTEAPRFVSKTPSVTNIDSFFDYFPHAHLLVIVRDGRSVVASGMSGFGWNFETASRHWAQAARRILNFSLKHADKSHRFKIVSYEQLNANTVETLEEIFSFLNLDASVFDFEAALDLPVYGSSYMKESGKQVTWKPQEKKKGFNAGERWNSWDLNRHHRFNWIAGEELEAFNYKPVREGSAGFGYVAKHQFKDMLYSARQFPSRLLQAVRVGVRTFLKEFAGDGSSNVNLKR